jgi:hypothetical protein
VVRQGSAKPLFIGSIPIAASIFLGVGMVATGAETVPETGALYGELTPSSELLTLPGATPGVFHTLRASRQEVALWGQSLAVLLYSGPLAEGQSERHDGRYSLVMIPRNPAQEILFLEREVWPAIGSPFMSAGGFSGLEPEEVPAPEDVRLERLEVNLLRAAWYPVAQDLGLLGGGGRTATGTYQGALRRLREVIIAEEERNGFLHESQHALDEAWKVYPDRYRRVAPDPVVAELRAALAALAHSTSPHYELYQSVRQYRQRMQFYEEAVGRMLAWLAAEVLLEPEAFKALRPNRNILLQLPRLSPSKLRNLAARVMERYFAASDRQAGYRLIYRGGDGSVAGLHVGSSRGQVQAGDLPETGLPPEPLAAWGFTGPRVVTHGVHMFLSERGVQPAQAEGYGLAVGPGGYIALLLRAGDGPWDLHLQGGLFREGETAGSQLPFNVQVGEGIPAPVMAGPQPGRFRVHIPREAASEDILRIVLQGDPAAGAPVFLTGFQLVPVNQP